MNDYNPTTSTPYALQEHLGYRITKWEENLAVIELELTSLHMNRHNIPHGGIYALLIDTAAGFCGTNQGPVGKSKKAMTLSLTCNFIAQPKGKRLIATGRKVGGGRKSFFSTVDLKDETGVLIATGQGTMRYRTEI